MKLTNQLLLINLCAAVLLVLVMVFTATGFQKAVAAWNDYREGVGKQRGELVQLTAELGYTGLIHDLKNYVLRGETLYYDSVVVHRGNIDQTLDRYIALAEISSEEEAAIIEIRRMADAYVLAADRVRDHRHDNPDARIHDLDVIAKVDDGPYVVAMQALTKNANERMVAHADQLESELSGLMRQTWLVGGLGLLTILGGGSWMAVRIGQKQLEKDAALAEQAELAEQANRAKGEFLVHMSHEIRQPLTAILGYTELLTEHKLSSKQQVDHVRAARRHGERLLQVIDDVMDLAKIEAGTMDLVLTRCSPLGLAMDVVALLEPRAEASGIELRFQVLTQIPETVRTDALRLRQVMYNLVTNAIKFTEVGTVTVKLSCISSTSGETKIQFDVVDTGLGMDRETLDVLFDTHPGAVMPSQGFGGTRLKLLISSKIAKMLDGKLDVSSQLNVGSAFSFTFVAHQPSRKMLKDISQMHGGNEESEAKLIKRWNTDGKKVLLVESDPDSLLLKTHRLEEAGFEVDTLSRGDLALSKVLESMDQDHAYEAVVINVSLAYTDGTNAVQAMRAAGYTKPIVGLTRATQPGEAERWESEGYNTCFEKPVDRNVLLEAVCQQLERMPEATLV